jgi:hypothetical protein
MVCDPGYLARVGGRTRITWRIFLVFRRGGKDRRFFTVVVTLELVMLFWSNGWQFQNRFVLELTQVLEPLDHLRSKQQNNLSTSELSLLETTTSTRNGKICRRHLRHSVELVYEMNIPIAEVCLEKRHEGESFPIIGWPNVTTPLIGRF